jgi:hypothetical protein
MLFLRENLKNNEEIVFFVEIIDAHRFMLPKVFQGGNAPGAWAMTPLVALKRAVGIRNDTTLYGLHEMKATTYVYV